MILAGITISALTGSDSAPAKANEAEQKNDIGSAKDQIGVTAINAKTEAYDAAYVGNGISSTEASNSVGRAVIKAVAEQIQANNQVGKATIAITGYGTLDNINNNAMIEITTRDFIVEGTITIKDGILTWGEIDENKPGIKFNVSSPLTIYEDAQQDVTATLKQIPANSEVEWTISENGENYVTVTPKTDTKQATIKGKAKTTENVIITASAGGYSATIEVKVEEEQLDKISTKKPTSAGTDFEAISTSKTTTLKDEVGNKVKVPKNFRIHYDSGIYVQDGVVIEDSNGNQFVWVPVGKIKKANKTANPITTTDVEIPFGRYSTFTLQNSKYQPVQDVSNGYVTTTSTHAINPEFFEFKNDTESNAVKGATYGNTKANNIQDFVESANTNGGYYIARYEAGVKGVGTSDTNLTYSIPNGTATPTTFNKNGTLNSTTNLYELSTSDASYLVSKKDVGVWNYINQPNAALMCKNMYATGSGVTSDLMNSYAWDTAIIFIQQCGQNNSYASRSGQSTDTSKPAATGTNTLSATSAVDVQCNIYDMAGNVREWTTESYVSTSNPCVIRGGNSSGTNTTSSRNFRSTTDANKHFGFRPLLYL